MTGKKANTLILAVRVEVDISAILKNVEVKFQNYF